MYEWQSFPYLPDPSEAGDHADADLVKILDDLIQSRLKEGKTVYLESTPHGRNIFYDRFFNPDVRA